MSDFPQDLLIEQIRAIPEGLLVVDAQEKILSCNPFFVELWQIPQAILDAKDYANALTHIMHQIEEPEGFLERLREIQDSGVPKSRDTLFLKDGRVIERFGKSITGNDGNHYGWGWYFRNSTEPYHNVRELERQKQLYIKVEQEKNERENQFQTLANSIPQLAWMADNEGWIYWYNDRWYDYTGTTLDEMKGWGWQRVHHPDHVAHALTFIAAAWDKQEPWELTFPLRRQDGEFRWFLTRAHPVKDASGAIRQWMGTNTDIHDQLESEKALKRSEEQLKQLSDFMPQMVWTTDPSGYHDFFNNRWYEFTGLSYEETRDTGWSRVLHPDEYEGSWKKWRHSLQTGDLYETEYRMKRADGTYRWLLARATPFRNEGGEIIRWFGTCTDIHDQKVASDLLELKVAERTRDLQEANSYLQSINEELRQFNYVASHDLQEPLRKIMIFSERIKAQDYEQLSENSRSFLDRMAVSAERMSALLKDLLDFSSTQREELFIQVNLNDTISDIEGDLELMIAQKSAVIQREELPTLKAIPLQMHQLFYNLINNALKFTSPLHNPVVRIQGTPVPPHLAVKWALSPEVDYYHFTVADNGIGFEQEFADRIFVLFKRLHSQKTFQGTGVGLALCKKVVENHQGRIWAESEPERGTTFHVVLPIQ